MHDKAPVHTAQAVQGAFEELGTEMMVWPPHSPDLNPIENIWTLVKTIYKLCPELEHASKAQSCK